PPVYIKENEISPEQKPLARVFAVRRESHTRAIKDQAVVAADLIDIHHGTPLIHRDGAQHLETQRALVNRVRRSRDIQQQGSSLPDQLGHGITVVAAAGPEILVVPGVFANGDSELLAVKPEHGLALRGLKITRFVEDVVRGKQHL